MAITVKPIPYGLRDVKVATLDATGTKGSLVDLPNAQTMEFNETTNTQTLRGDDKVVARRTTLEEVEWTLEAGGMSIEAGVVMVGGTVAETGTTPNQKKTWTRLGTDAYPDFYAVGQAMSETGGDLHLALFRCKANEFSGTFQDQEFWVTHMAGTGIGSLNVTDVDKVWAFIQNETATAVA